MRSIEAERILFLASRNNYLGAQVHLSSFCSELCFRSLYVLDPIKQIRLAWQYARDYLSVYETRQPNHPQVRQFVNTVEQFLYDQHNQEFFFDYKNLAFEDQMPEQFDSYNFSIWYLYESCKEMPCMPNVLARVVSSIHSYINQKKNDIEFADDPAAFIAMQEFMKRRADQTEEEIEEEKLKEDQTIKCRSSRDNLLLDAVVCREWEKLARTILDILSKEENHSFKNLDYYKELDHIVELWKLNGFEKVYNNS